MDQRKMALNFTRNVINKFPVSEDHTRIGLMYYAAEPYDEFLFNAYFTKDEINQHIDELDASFDSKGFGPSKLPKALIRARTYWFADQETGFREDSTKVIVIIWDGSSGRAGLQS